ncbi:hypothetical protein [Blautia producta]|uniref:hypothetical protein n=1 Tax=Blautia producta TaxID=33035 RepID=UPI0031B5B778
MELLLTKQIVFDAKPDAVPYNYRISYKVSQICLIVAMCCSRGGCSLVKLHIISNALNTRAYMDILDDYANDRTPFMIARFDPAVNRAIKYAIADKLLVQQKNGKFRLADKGKSLVKKMEKEKDLLVVEKEYLTKLGTRLTDERLERLISYWRYSNADNQEIKD